MATRRYGDGADGAIRRRGDRANKLGTENDTSYKNVMKNIRHFRDLDVYQGAIDLVMRIRRIALSPRRRVARSPIPIPSCRELRPVQGCCGI
jgi:hypothetical protein